MDGTLCDVESIRHYVTGEERNFDKFHRASLFCPPHEWVVKAALNAYNYGRDVLIVTARERKYERVTRDWLAKHGVLYNKLYMRQHKDYRKDAIIKAEILDTIKADGYDPIVAYEDREDVREVWVSAGINVMMVR
jgi:hypothetical protein